MQTTSDEAADSMGLEPTADAVEIKTACRRLARKYHPDVSKEEDAEQKFKDLGEACEVLKDLDTPLMEPAS